MHLSVSATLGLLQVTAGMAPRCPKTSSLIVTLKEVLTDLQRTIALMRVRFTRGKDNLTRQRV